MFEKEAEEYVCKRNPLVTKEWFIDAFKKYNKGEKVKYLKDCEIAEREAYIAGAEFGYNKVMNEQGYKIESAYREGVAFGKDKANEWHYVKDKDYPKDNKPVLCILGDIDSDNCEVGYYNDVGSGEPWHFETYHLPDDDGDNAWGVFAWKEIVLPELKESE